MNVARREIRVGTFALVAAGPSAWTTVACRALPSDRERMFGLIGKMTAVPGQRDALVTLQLDGIGDMPDCLSYVVATDPGDADAIRVTEVWEIEASHRASLSLPSVREAIAKGRPLIAALGPSTVTAPVGGHGLTAPGLVPAIDRPVPR